MRCLAILAISVGVMFSTGYGVDWIEAFSCSSKETKSNAEEEVRIEVAFRIRTSNRFAQRVTLLRHVTVSHSPANWDPTHGLQVRSIFPICPHNFSNGVGGPLRC
jgi:hypothetical protein